MKKLGQILVERTSLSTDKVHQALQHQQIFGGRLGTCLLELNLVDEEVLSEALSEQAHVPAASVEDLRSIPEAVLQLVPARMAFKSKVMPFDRYSTEARVALIDTKDLILQDELAFVTSKRLKVYIAPEIRILEALEKHYGCDIDQRYQRIWDRLNRARYLWQEKTESPNAPEAVKANSVSPPAARSRVTMASTDSADQWKPSPAPHLQTPSPPPPVVGKKEAQAAVSTPEDKSPGAPTSSPKPSETKVSEASIPTLPMEIVVEEKDLPARSESSTPQQDVEPEPASVEKAPRREPTPGSESVSTRPMPSMATPESVADLEALMMSAEERDHIAHALMLYLSESFSRVLCFMVRGDEVAGWLGTGLDVDESQLEQFRLDFTSPSIFLNLKAGTPIYRGPLPKMAAHESLISIWGGRYPRECLLVPVQIKGRLVTVIYLDKGRKALGGIDLGEIQEIGRLTSRAFESFLVRRRESKAS